MAQVSNNAQLKLLFLDTEVVGTAMCHLNEK